MKKTESKFNIITAEGVDGIYKDKHITIEIAEHAADCKLYVDGEIINDCNSIQIKMGADKRTEIILNVWAEME